jgi:Dimethyladenosine transferase (rRNA methylation)
MVLRKRRKMLRNNLSFTHLSQEEIQSILLGLGISPAARAETISLEKLAKLADIIDEHLNN